MKPYEPLVKQTYTHPCINVIFMKTGNIMQASARISPNSEFFNQQWEIESDETRDIEW